MKRRQRRPVLDINGEQSDSPRRRWQNKYEQIAADHPEQNGTPVNPLSNLLEQYNSDSETEDAKAEGRQGKLDDQVNDFLKEIQLIAPEPPVAETAGKNKSSAKEPQETSTRVPSSEQSTLWQECFDDSTGYPYYWHVETNEVTWDVPEEIRQLREVNQQDTLNRTSYSTQWVNFSSNTYPQPQINIPEGMIPKEVVARNRNRQVSNQPNAQQGSQTQQNNSRNSSTKEDESDDGKIEMITSFGSDGSESETSDNDSPVKKSPEECQTRKNQPKPKSLRPPGRKPTLATGKKVESSEKNVKIGPLLPAGIVPMVHGPENSTKADHGREKWRRKEEEKSSRHSEKSESSCESKSHSNSIETSSYLSKKLLEFKEKIEDKESHVTSTGKQLKFSLVPGYADDSDVEEDVAPKKDKPLFPIAEFQGNSATTVVSHDGTVKKVETKYTDTGSVRIFQYHSSSSDKSENLDDEVKQINQDLDPDVQESVNSEETRVVRMEEEGPKPNIFLENLEVPSKAFQRKKRIAFDVVLNKNRSNDSENVTKNVSESVPSPPATMLGNETDRHGLGFQKESRNADTEDSEDPPDGKSRSPSSEKSLLVSKGSIGFVKGETMIPKPEETATIKEKTEAEINELKRVTETIMEKLKFLSEGGQPASAVQAMAIQLQTLLAAWEAGDLKDSYLENWLTGTGRELGRLEDAAAPPGWDCQWDRSHKRYFYRNSTTGDAQWTYPEADVIGGTEEMELCTTPPPQDQEEPCIIESQVDKPSELSTSEKDNGIDESAETQKYQGDESKELLVPPPPQISSPSPPPPPRIYAEDLRKGKKRRGSPHAKNSESKKDKISKDGRVNDTSKSKETVNPPLPPSPTKPMQPPLPPHPPIVPNPPSSEPLPPGVDPPDLPFTMTAPSIETTMMYTATGPQTNPIYAATIGDPTVPILSHHTALMQGQLMHYPTYHQHLHNQALIAAANRLTGQEAVQFMMDYSQVYANTQVIAKPPVKTHKESLGSALNSFYNDIATMEKTRNDNETEPLLPTEPVPVAATQTQQEVEAPAILTDSVLKERKKKKTKLGISKKQKEVSSMVAKWQKAQHYEDNN